MEEFLGSLNIRTFKKLPIDNPTRKIKIEIKIKPSLENKIINYITNKKPRNNGLLLNSLFGVIKSGNDLLSHAAARIIPSAR